MLEEYSLNGEWQIKPDNKNQGKDLGYFLNDIDVSNWLKINIPCHWELILPEFYKSNPQIVWARKEFTLDEIGGKQVCQSNLLRLLFKGIFYYTDVYFNGHYLGTHEGYFEPFGFIINKYLQEQNNLVLRIQCLEEHNLGNKKQILGTIGHWDASDPYANPGGIWNDVSIIISKKLAIEHVRKITKLENLKLSREKIYIRITSMENLSGNLKISYIPKNFPGESISKEYPVSIKKGNHEYSFQIEISNPGLWWTYDYGPQNLYTLSVECYLKDSQQKNTILDTYSFQTGIKEFQMKRGGKDGGKWIINFNKHSFFPKGTNYPPWQRLQTATKTAFQNDLKIFKNANMNILRVHANLSRPEFYDACDEEGIILWQDLPLQWVYSKEIFPEIKRQAKIAVELHQSHPCIAIWCAHNEPFFVPDMNIIKKSAIFFIFTVLTTIILGFYLHILFSSLISPSILSGLISLISGLGYGLLLLKLAGKYYDLYPFGLFTNSNSVKLDPELYLLISKVEERQNSVLPYSGICELPYFTIFRSTRLNPKIFGFKKFYTDFHYYAGWYNGSHHKDYRYHIKWWGYRGKLRNKARFVTEYGAQAFPKIDNLSKFYTLPTSWPPDPEWWKCLIKDHRFQKNIQEKYVKVNQYNSLEEYIDATQEWQAECIKATTEMFRQIKYQPLAGLITFLGIDCFPGITWAIIDYYRTPKKAYYELKNIFEPLYVMIDWPKKTYKPGEIYQSLVYVCNDYWNSIEKVEVNWEIFNPYDNTLNKGIISASIESDCVKEIGQITFQIPNVEYIILKLSWTDPQKNGKLFENRYQFDIGVSYWAKNF